MGKKIGCDCREAGQGDGRDAGDDEGVEAGKTAPEIRHKSDWLTELITAWSWQGMEEIPSMIYDRLGGVYQSSVATFRLWQQA